MVLNVLRKHKAYQGRREVGGGGRDGGVCVGGGEMESIYQTLLCHHQNDLCIKAGRDESHFNVS